MENNTFWRLILKINSDPQEKELIIDYTTLEKAVFYWFLYTNEKENGVAKYTVCGPLPMNNFTF